LEHNLQQSNLVEINAEASEKTEALRKFIKFDNNQRDQVYLAVQEYTKVMMSKKKVDKASLEKAKNNLETKMEAILSEEQYERYKTFDEQ
jgi:LPS O-antigen subunit length determinant protein (WzzB/FepE family)